MADILLTISAVVSIFSLHLSTSFPPSFSVFLCFSNVGHLSIIFGVVDVVRGLKGGRNFWYCIYCCQLLGCAVQQGRRSPFRCASEGRSVLLVSLPENVSGSFSETLQSFH